MQLINWERLAYALRFYEGLGYQQIEVPWLVGNAADASTRPALIKPLTVYRGDNYYGNLLASGEQGFAALLDAGYLDYGKRYCCCTPCFRDEPQYDALHRRTFVKVELIDLITPQDIKYRVVRDAVEFFGHHVDPKRISVVPTDVGLDIEVNGIEVGSYGVRTWAGHTWVYGTGLAEPRLTQAIHKGSA